MAADIGRLLTAMITPFKADGAVDYEAAQRLAKLLTTSGSDGVVVFGTTGEAPALTDDEKVELCRIVKQAIPDKTVIAGAGSNSTQHSVHLTQASIKAGADGILAVVPYYNKPPQEGMYRHFKAIAEAAGGKPVIMYNIQGRTGVNMTAATTIRCAEIPGIAGVKEASGDMDQMGLVCAGKPTGFRVWSGDDSFTLPLLAVGGYGVICVVSHIAGPAMKAMIEAFLKGDHERAASIHQGLLPVIKALMTTASNPIPIKTAINRLGFPAGPFRLPLAPLADGDGDRLMGVIKDAGELISFSPVGVA
ncbi:MAG: 4-hydroxy-tetrahydrodipicolinate synthase [Chloroflexi bacterium]|nr:MAG: 4-hydroxy-tetrahydrodipicolinate synthase [Chloroflexota bacterium]TME17704.1 MAG: 4-hydroxy-tetrahydrodipicolinate synthase [Chloroflexota bacterium]TME19280.1 MAG: 4-hydroxy-tetrahydrodipicolinate synthase [Chloroflexota bacterium]